jgi:hypothetical protein
VSDVERTLLAGIRVAFIVVALVALAVAAWQQRCGETTLRGLTRTAILQVTTPPGRRDVINELAHGARHYRAATDALWVAVAALVVTWWLS